jgi:hypothetical protein
MKLDNTSITLIIIAVLVVLYLMYGNGNAVDNAGYVASSSEGVLDGDEEDEDYEVSDDTSDNATYTTADSTTVDSDESSASYESLQRKMTGRNSILNNGGVPVKSSYADGTRGGSFDASLDTILAGSKVSGSSGVEPMEYEGADGYAGFKSSGASADDMFNSGSLLPAQQTDWFEVHNNVNVKNSHLINVYRPVGANTVAGSLRNASWDFRGDISNPKYVVSPWMQSTISPDNNIKGLC